MQGQNQGAQQNSQGIEIVYYLGALFVILGAAWYKFHVEIVAGILQFQSYQAYIMLFPLGLMSEIAVDILPAAQAAYFTAMTSQLAGVINTVQTINYADIGFTELMNIVSQVGIYFAAFTAPIWIAISVYIQTTGVISSFDEKYSMESFRRKEVVNCLCIDHHWN